MLLGRQPGPHLGGDRERITVVGRVGRRSPGAFQQGQLVFPGAGQHRLHQPGLAPEQEQQHARARPHGRGERAQRQVRHPVLERIPVGELEEFIAPRRGGRGHAAIV